MIVPGYDAPTGWVNIPNSETAFSTTIAAASNGVSLPTSTINLASVTGLYATSGTVSITTSAGVQMVNYTGISGTSLTGCTGGTGSMSTGGTVTQAVLREVGTVNALGTINTTTTLGTDFNTYPIRGAASTDGTNIWVSGAGGSSVGYTTLDSTSTPTTIATAPSTPRFITIQGNTLYLSSSSGSYKGVSTLGNPPPTASTTPTLLASDSTSVYGFYFTTVGTSNGSPNTLYVADNTNGILKFSYSSSTGTWTQDTGDAGTNYSGYDGLTGVTNGTTVTLYATTNNGQVVSLTDSTGNPTTSFTANANLLYTEVTNNLAEGVALAPTNSSLATTTLGTVTGPATAASNVAFSVSVPASTNLNGDQVLFEAVLTGASQPQFTQVGTGTVTGGTASGNVTIPANGNYQVYAYFVGNSSLNAAISSTPLSVLIGTPTAPTFSGATSTTFKPGFTGSFQFSATGNPNSITYSVAGPLPAGVTFTSSGLLSGQAVTSGSYPLTVTATNAAGSTPESFTLNVTPGVGGTPSNSSKIETDGPYGGTAYIAIFGTTANTYPGFGVFDETIPARPNATGITSLTFQLNENYYAADDIGGTVDLYLAGNSTVSYGSLAYQAGSNGYAAIDPQLDPIGSDAANDPLGQASYTPSSSNTGTLTFTLSASEISGYATLENAITTALKDGGTLRFIAVAATAATGYEVSGSTGANPPDLNINYTAQAAPYITSTNIAAFTLNQTGYFLVTADGTPAASFSATYHSGTSGTGAPGVTLSSSGLLSGAPTTPGVYTFTITASNGVSPNATQTFTLTVFSTSASAFTKGNLLADLVPTTGTSKNAGEVDLEELTTSGTTVQAVALPSTGTGAFTETVDPTRPEGFLTDASDGESVELAGYNVAAGTAVNGANGTIAVIEPNGTIDYSTQIPTADITDPKTGDSSVKAVASADGQGFYVATDDFIQYVPFGNSAASATTTISNFFTANDGTSGGYESTQSPFDVAIGGSDVTNAIQLYGDAGSQAQTDGVPAADGPFSVGNGLPTTGGQSATVYSGPDTTSSGSPAQYVTSEQFSFSPDGTTFIVADARTNGSGGLYEWQESISGTAFAEVASYNYTDSGLTGLSVTWNGDTPSAIYAVTTTSNTADTSGNSIVSINSSLTSSTVIATAPDGYTFTGVAMTPVAPVTTPATTTTLSVTNTGGHYGSVGLQATVKSGGNPVTSGWVSFRNGTTEIGAAPVNSSGVATLTPDTNFLAGSYTNLTAVYTGTGSYAASTSSPATSATVALYATSESLTDSDSGRAATGTADTLTDTLSVPAGTTPSGTIQFYDNGTAIGSLVSIEQVIANGSISFTATLSYTFTTTGIADITASYSGDSNFAAISQSSSPTHAINVVNGTTTVVTSNNNNPGGSGVSVTFTATVTGTPSAGVPTGTVQFYVNGIAVGGSITLTQVTGSNDSSSAQLTVSTSLVETAPGTLTPGVDSVTAIYTPSNNYEGSTGALNQPVQPKPFGVGDQLIYQTGDGSGLPNFDPNNPYNDNVVYIDDFHGTTLVQQIVMPSVTANGYNALTQQGSNGTAGFFDATTSGNGWVLGGVDYTLVLSRMG